MSNQRATFRLWLRQLSRALLPRHWWLRAELRRIDRRYKLLVAQAKGEEYHHLRQDYAQELGSVEEKLEGLQTQQLLRQAWRYSIAASEKPWDHEGREDDNWRYGWLRGTWYLKRAAMDALRRRIEEAQQRRHVVWQSWVTMLGPMFAALAALVTAFVSLILTWWR